MSVLANFAKYLWGQIVSVGVNDIIDIIIVTLILYYLINFIYDRRAGKLTIGIFILFALLGISSLLKLNVLTYILQNIVQVGILALFIVFQPELRSMLEKLGNNSIKNLKIIDNKPNENTENTIEIICETANELSETKTGALIVIERGTKLGDNIKTGVIVNADVNKYLLKNIFFDKAPLHDGAVIIRDNRVYACGCFLPLSYNSNIIRNVGTRHRAAIGMSENSDAVIIIVSEETGTISIAMDGELKRSFDAEKLKKELTLALIGETVPKNKIKVIKRKKEAKGGNKDEK